MEELLQLAKISAKGVIKNLKKKRTLS